MNHYRILIYEKAILDIKEAANFYENKQKGLGVRFKQQVKKQINSLKINPNGFTVRYDDVRCMLIKKFPFLVHFKVDNRQNIVSVFAIYHTSRNPEIWLLK
jgi:hypothetical protein